MGLFVVFFVLIFFVFQFQAKEYVTRGVLGKILKGAQSLANFVFVFRRVLKSIII